MNGPLTNSALEAIKQTILVCVKIKTAREAMARDALQAHFQPIVRLNDGVVVAHESLIRGPAGTELA